MPDQILTSDSRRDFLKKAAVGGAVAAWSVPMVTSVAHAQATGTVELGECCRVKWNTDHADFQTSCHDEGSFPGTNKAKNEVNRSYGFQIPDPKDGSQFGGLLDDDISPDNQCCETSVLEWNDPALDCSLTLLSDVITVTGDSHAVLPVAGGSSSMTCTVDNSLFPECYLTDPNVMFGGVSELSTPTCTTGASSASGVKARTWTITWSSKAPIFVKFMFMCGDSIDCDDVGEEPQYIDSRTIALG